MSIWRRMVGILAMALAGLTACSSTTDQAPSTTVTPSVAVTPTALPDFGITLSPLAEPSPRAESSSEATYTRIPPSQPTGLDIGGAHPIHAKVLPYSQPGILLPPAGNYHDVFFWTLRGEPGDGATDTTYLFGHTYSGATNGVLDNLRDVVLDDHQQVIKGTKFRVTTKTGVLTYCVSNAYTVPKDELQEPSQARIWAIQPLAERGNYLVIIACFLSDDGSEQTGDNLAVVAERC